MRRYAGPFPSEEQALRVARATAMAAAARDGTPYPLPSDPPRGAVSVADPSIALGTQHEWPRQDTSGAWWLAITPSNVGLPGAPILVDGIPTPPARGMGVEKPDTDFADHLV